MNSEFPGNKPKHRSGARCRAAGALAMLICLLAGTPAPPTATAGESCDVQALVDGAASMMQMGKEPRRVLDALEEASQCEDGDRDYYVNFFLALTKIRLGRIDDARRHAARAERLAYNDKERELAGRLIRILNNNFYPVTFVRPDGGSQAVAVRLSRIGELPEPSDLMELLPPDLAPFMNSAYQDAVRAIDEFLRHSTEAPVTVWLPKSQYTLSNKQTFEITKSALQVPVLDIRWSLLTTQLHLGTISALPMHPNKVTFPDHIRMGPVLHQGIRVGEMTLIDLELGFFSAAIWKESSNYKPNSLEWYAADGHEHQYDEGYVQVKGNAFTTVLGLGVIRPIGIAGDVSLLPGFYLRGMMMGYLAVGVTEPYVDTGSLDTNEKPGLRKGSKAISAPEEDGSTLNPDNAYWMNWTGLVAAPDFKLYYPLARGERFQGGIMGGMSIALGWGSYGSAPPPPSTDPTSAPLPTELPLTINATDHWMLVLGLQLGASFRFL